MVNNKEKDQQTLVIVKPDGLKKSLTGNILTKISETRLRIIGAKVVRVSRKLAEKHYAHLKDHPHFEEIIKYIQGKLHGRQYERVLALIYQGKDAIRLVRNLVGATNPEEAEPTSIRGSYGRITRLGTYENVIHCSANEKESEQEIKLWFNPDEIVEDIYPTMTGTTTEVTSQTPVKKRIWK